ncbi:GNAT family N-acetyltransferase [Bacillus sp. HMF5848]|uniref:GNAT family N-acetyltransferase n=1 Tax=Bacillus sp. HMF5848 TaxID=2495421 RepID=UPI000F77A368|nr:GNAT family N-acetyltransferase [Bacillus sp. HMF5848]RSK26774.1 GNAT family N-acetyltransferase [Bacillus sp. HMF5848]
MKIVRATLNDVEFVAPLFNKYRVYYDQPSQLKAAIRFLYDRLSMDESVVFIAVDEVVGVEKALGFIQMYPSFSSVSLEKLWVLNDLYVEEDERQRGVARALLMEAKKFAVDSHTKGIILETTPENKVAQNFYEKIGFKRDENIHYYYFQ